MYEYVWIYFIYDYMCLWIFMYIYIFYYVYLYILIYEKLFTGQGWINIIDFRLLLISFRLPPYTDFIHIHTQLHSFTLTFSIILTLFWFDLILLKHFFNLFLHYCKAFKSYISVYFSIIILYYTIMCFTFKGTESWNPK